MAQKLRSASILNPILTAFTKESTKLYVTHISQYEVRILTKNDFEGYERNKPNDKWELIEYVNVKDKNGDKLRAWVPKYTLQYPKFTDHSKLRLGEIVNG